MELLDKQDAHRTMRIPTKNSMLTAIEVLPGQKADPLSDEGIRAVWGPSMTHEECETKRIEIANLSRVMLNIVREEAVCQTP